MKTVYQCIFHTQINLEIHILNTNFNTNSNIIRVSAKKVHFLLLLLTKFLEVWRFGKPTKLEIEDGEICGVDAQAQGGSGEIRKVQTT